MTTTDDIRSIVDDNEVVVFSKPGCAECTATKKFLSDNDIEYLAIDISESDAARDFIIGEGVMRMPYVVTGKAKWSGLNKARLRSLIA